MAGTPERGLQGVHGTGNPRRAREKGDSRIKAALTIHSGVSRRPEQKFFRERLTRELTVYRGELRHFAVVRLTQSPFKGMVNRFDTGTSV